MIKDVVVTHLKIGMYIHRFPGGWTDHPFLKGSFRIESLNQIKLIKKNGIKAVSIDTSKGLDVEVKKTEVKPAPKVSHQDKEPDPDQSKKNGDRQVAMEKAISVCSYAKEQVKEMFDDVRMGKACNLEGVGSVVNSVVSSLEFHDTALLSVARLKTHDDYSYMHSVAVCGLMISLANKLDLGEEQIKKAGMAGLLHDIGKAKMPESVLNKPGKLTGNEYQIMQLHPVIGYELLSKASVDKEALDVCLHHHEKYDGTGYPDQLSAENISVFSRMGAICDVYDAITSNRPYKDGWEPAYALKKMASWAGHYDKDIFRHFVSCIGIFPDGSLVKLNSGDLAVVIEQNSGDLMRPVVKKFYSTVSKEMRPMEIIDLGRTKKDLSIESVEKSEDWGLDVPTDLWM